MNEQKEFKPDIPAERVTPELTVTSIVMGIILAVVFGAANAYLGLRVGMTISASIPAAVLAMGVIRVIMRKNSILESNIVQTIGSAGESLAAGAIFTLPALFLWAADGKMETPSILEIALIALLGGLLGVLFMVPLRNALIVKEHGILPYPEGTACAEVLLAGEEGGANASTVFAGMGFAAIFKFVIDGFKLVPSEVSLRVKGFAGEIGTQIYPAVMSVGYICGPRISSYMFAGGLVSWMVLIPAVVLFGADLTLYPGTAPIGQMFAEGGASAIWGSYIRYIGAGALAAGGIISLAKSLPLIIRTFSDAMKSLKGNTNTNTTRTGQDINMGVILGGVLLITIAIWLAPPIPVTFLGAIIVVIFGFFFATVSSRMVGLVGSSNNPVSGMAIATLLIATILLKATGDSGIHGAGVMENNLPWTLVFIGVFLAIAVEIVGIPVLPFAIGVYLPVQLNACIMVGGLVRLAFDKMNMKDKKKKDAIINDGVLYCSGMIAGEGLIGILLAVFAVFHVDKAIDLSSRFNLPASVSNIGSLVVFALVILSLLKFSLWRKRKENK